MADLDAPRWYHCTTHTYGAWLPGDPRGFRTRHHREHIEGDYKRPPAPGTYTERHAASRELMPQAAVVFAADLREFVCRTLVTKLQSHGAQVLAASVSGRHVHFLARMPAGPTPRKWIGSAKRQVTFALKARGWTGEVWAARSKVNPIKDYRHQVNTFNYILDHRDEGAWVWDYRVHNAPDDPPKAH